MRDLLRRMAAVYERATTYADTGVVTQTLVRPEGRQVERLPFATAFERPRRFRYQFSDEAGDRLTITQDTPPARLVWTKTKEDSRVELPMALAGATGVSGGSAQTIPRLLMPAVVPGLSLTELNEPVEDGREVIDGINCIRVRGQRGAEAVSLWIGADDLLVRRIVRAQHVGADMMEQAMASLPEEYRAELQGQMADLVTDEFDSEVETIYQPRVNVPLGDADFAA